MTSKFLLENKYILVDKKLNMYRLIDYGTKIVVCDIYADKISFIKQNLTHGEVDKKEFEQDVKIGDVYSLMSYQFFSEDVDYIQEIDVYDKSNNQLNVILTFLKSDPRYRKDEAFRRSLDISIICDDISHLKDFFIH